MTPTATLARVSTKPSTRATLDERTLEAILMSREPQMQAMLDSEISVAQEHRDKPDLPSRDESLLVNAKAPSLSPRLRLKSIRRLCGDRCLGELDLSPEVLAAL